VGGDWFSEDVTLASGVSGDRRSGQVARKSTCLSSEDGTDWLCRNVGTKVPIYAALNPRTAQVSFTLRRKPLITLVDKFRFG
jgi:hypothetical protein